MSCIEISTQYIRRFPSDTHMIHDTITTTQGRGADTYKLDSAEAASAAVLFKGDLREPDALQVFLDKYVVAKKPAPKEAEMGEKAQGKDKKGKNEEGEEKGPGEKRPSWKELNATNFKAEVYQATDAWLVWLKPKAGACMCDKTVWVCMRVCTSG